MSRRYLLVITILPSVIAETVPVAPEEDPVIVSDVVKTFIPDWTKLMGLEVLIILPLAPEEDPVINSP